MADLSHDSQQVLLAFGCYLIGVMAFGVISFYADTQRFSQSISDDEIIKRAKELGMVEIKTRIDENGE